MLAGLKAAPSLLFSFILPEDCRICERSLRSVSRIPVCAACLSLPQTLQSEYFCCSCRTPFVNASPLDEQGLCTICRESLANFDAAYSFGSYEGVLRNLIHLFKYGKVETLARPLAGFLTRALPLEEQFDLVIAMPIHWRKQWERGFNQAELLAQPIARRYGAKLVRNLRKSRYTRPQAGLSEAERRKNLKGSFVVRHPAEIAGKRILLVDDVFTTGATLRAAAEALKKAGAGRVAALTLARVDVRAPLARQLEPTMESVDSQMELLQV